MQSQAYAKRALVAYQAQAGLARGMHTLSGVCKRKGEPPMETINRREVARALAKALAYAECGQHVKACEWARELVRLLECAEILRSDRASAPRGWTYLGSVDR